ncbi:hypothetical protein [Paracraurococcus ruber]|uniref:Uncharacterized protein n=1 Tax=Paracraurococcus ruber TaxID=77675 RepID=A0ABS1D5U7_9PROT|nr:hypothetical protein [Paracraurococcus ruber]MBK1661715.1 hypothetical protein [Paracraurococcus ruber]TDG32613.1 hypothetical protein E2C05_06365 [Paracraurococcus ruber]
MPITVDSSQWTGEQDDASMAGPVVWGEFAERAALDRAAERLRAEPWFQQSQAAAGAGDEGAADNRQVIMPDEHPGEASQRNLRTNWVGTATAGTSMLAAGLVIATGGAALPAVAAAAAAGGATLAAGEAVGMAADPHNEARKADAEDARTAGPALGIAAAAPEMRQRAEAFLREAGASRVWVQDPVAG